VHSDRVKHAWLQSSTLLALNRPFWRSLPQKSTPISSLHTHTPPGHAPVVVVSDVNVLVAVGVAEVGVSALVTVLVLVVELVLTVDVNDEPMVASKR
jgi:hypothetical protein